MAPCGARKRKKQTGYGSGGAFGSLESLLSLESLGSFQRTGELENWRTGELKNGTDG